MNLGIYKHISSKQGLHTEHRIENEDGVTLNELEGLQLTCNEIIQSCHQYTQTFSEEEELHYLNLLACITILFGFILFCRAIAYLSVRFLKH